MFKNQKFQSIKCFKETKEHENETVKREKNIWEIFKPQMK